MTKEFLEEQHIQLQKSGADIAKTLGCTTSLVCAYLKRHGIPNMSNTYKIGKLSSAKSKFTSGHISWNTGISTPSPNKGKRFPRGELHWNWKGGQPTSNSRMKLPEYRDWRTSVFMRDNYTCVHCNQRGGELNADHIKPWCLFEELRFDLDNGRTLCVECHKKTDTYGNKALQYNDGGVMKSVTLT